MNNYIHSFPPADSRTICAILPPFISKATDKAIRELSEKLTRLRKEREKWSRTAGEEELKRRDKALATDPSDETIAAVSAESRDELKARYSEMSNRLYVAYERIVEEGRPLVNEIVDDLMPLLAEEVKIAEQSNRATYERYGLKYDRATDPVVGGLERCAQGISDRLGKGSNEPAPELPNAPRRPAWDVTRLPEVIGEWKVRSGVFSN